MQRLTRGNLLATLKELKKMPRPKISVIAPASVQAIVGNTKPIKKVDTHSNVITAIQRRRALFNNTNQAIPIDSEEYKKIALDFEDFMTKYKELKQHKGSIV